MDSAEGYLHSYRPRDYPAAALAADLVVFAVAGGALWTALVRRGGQPFKDTLALPGGFVGPEEDALAAALRELAEETGLGLAGLRARTEQLAAFTAPHRDPRMRVVSVAHLTLLGTDGGDLPELAGGSDAAEARWHPVHDVLAGAPLAFDHTGILRTALDRLAGGMEDTLVAARLLPERFTMAQLQGVYEAVWNATLPAADFTRRLAGALRDTGMQSTDVAGAPVPLFEPAQRFISPPLHRP